MLTIYPWMVLLLQCSTPTRNNLSCYRTAMMHVTRLSVQQEQFVQHSTTASMSLAAPAAMHLPMKLEMMSPMPNAKFWIRHLRSRKVLHPNRLSLIPNLFREFTAEKSPYLLDIKSYNLPWDHFRSPFWSPYFFVKSPQSGWWENPQGRPSGIPTG